MLLLKLTCLACSTPIIPDTSAYTSETLGDADSNTSYCPSQEQVEEVLNEGEKQTAADIEDAENSSLMSLLYYHCCSGVVSLVSS